MRRNRSWLAGLPFGLPADFDFTVLRTPNDASYLIATLPNSDRGKAAKLIVDQTCILGRSVAYRALIDAWDRDHQHVLRAFDEDELEGYNSIAKAFRMARMRSVNGWYALSWTRDRDLACWFAMRNGATPFVYVCDIEPSQILVEHDGRDEREVLVDIDAVLSISLDEGDGSERDWSDIRAHSDVTMGALKNWKAAFDRRVAKIRADNQARLASTKI
jgi:hypothetical protein